MTGTVTSDMKGRRVISEQTVSENPPTYISRPNTLGDANNGHGEWVQTLQDLQRNLATLDDIKRSDRATAQSGSSMIFMQSLFTSSSFRSRRAVRVKNAQLLHQDYVQRARVLEELILHGMRKLAHIHPDPAARSEWSARSEQFANVLSRNRELAPNGIPLSDLAASELESNEKEKESILEGLGKGLAILLMTPFLVAGAALFASGALMYGVGKTIVGLGHLFTFGKLK